MEGMETCVSRRMYDTSVYGHQGNAVTASGLKQ
jgi:hypothetical protein